MVRIPEAAADRVLRMFVPKVTAQAATCTCWTEYCSCSSTGYVRVRGLLQGLRQHRYDLRLLPHHLDALLTGERSR